MKRIRVIHIINSFEFGGAEAMLCNLLLRTNRERFEPSVVSLIDEMPLIDPVRNAGIPVVTMGMKPAVPDPRGVLRLVRHLRDEQPAVVQTWMDHSNLIGGLAARASTRARVVWGVHHSNHVPGLAKRTTLMTVTACARLSKRVPARIVFCSEEARTLYARRGFAASKSTVIPNGFDTSAFCPDPEARVQLRRELGIDPDAPVIGLVARYHPLKDHTNFLKAAALLAKRRPQAQFLMCGSGVDADNGELVAQVVELGLADRCHLLGPRRDMPRIYAALDVAASSSISEAFPLAIGEAMSAGVPCVATNVGDSALMIGAMGRIVPPQDSHALAAAWDQLLSMDAGGRTRLGLRARDRIRELFDLGAVTSRYEALYEQIAAGDGPGNIQDPGSKPCDDESISTGNMTAF